MWNLATAPAWSDLLHITLWRNDEFLHSFCNFSKSNAFGENFIRIKFILHKIYFRMSIFSSRKTLRVFFDLCWKNCEKPFVWGQDHFEGKECLATKININFFVRNEFLNIFRITIFSKRKKNSKMGKIILGSMTIFQVIGCPMTKMNITFSMGNGVPSMALKFFPQRTPHTGWMIAKKPDLELHFPPCQWFYRTDCFQKNRVHLCVDSHPPCEFHENRLKTSTRTVTGNNYYKLKI